MRVLRRCSFIHETAFSSVEETNICDTQQKLCEQNCRIQFISIKFNFPKILGSQEMCWNFRREILLLSLLLKKNINLNLKKIIKINFIFSAPQSLIPSCWLQNAPCKNRAWSNYPKRSLNWHLFLSINIDSAPSWKICMANSVWKVHFEDYIYTIEFSRKKKIDTP